MTPAQSAASEQFYLAAVVFAASLVGVMLLLVVGFKVAWLVHEARQGRRVITDDPQQEYRDAAADAAILAWSSATWADFERVERGRS